MNVFHAVSMEHVPREMETVICGLFYSPCNVVTNRLGGEDGLTLTLDVYNSRSARICLHTGKNWLLDDKQVFPDIANAAIGLGAYEMEQIFDTQVSCSFSTIGRVEFHLIILCTNRDSSSHRLIDDSLGESSDPHVLY